MKKVLTLLLASILLLCVFTACKKDDMKVDSDNGFSNGKSAFENDTDDRNPIIANPDSEQSKVDEGDGSCDHTYSDSWSSSSTGHWHKATCEHTDLKSNVANHTDTDEDGFCDVCSYEVGHTHTFTEAWSYDATHHWKTAICSHTLTKGSLEEHIDANSDGACDFCAIHMHVVSVFGVCTVCGTKLFDTDIADIGEAVDIALLSSSRVLGGKIKYENVCTELKKDMLGQNNDIMSILSTQEREILYTLGPSSAYYKVTSKATHDGTVRNSLQESWYQGFEDNSVFGVYSTNSGPLMLDAATQLNLIGYNLVVSSIANARGPENLLNTLYKLSQSSYASEYACDYIEGTYSFSFNYLQLNTGTGADVRADYYELAVSFTLSDKGALVGLDVRCDCYTNSLYYEDPIEDDLNNDYTFDQSTYKITMKDTAIPDTYTYSIVQYEGRRTYVSEHPKSEFIPDDFKLYLDPELTEEVIGTVSATNGKGVRIYLGAFVPTGTSVSYLNDGFAAFCDSPNVICSVNAISSSVLVFAKEGGTYTVRIIAGDVVKEFVVEASTSTEQGTESPENSVVVYITDNNAWVDLAVFTAAVDGNYTFTIAPGTYLGAMTDGGVPWADFNNVDESGVPKGGSITVSLKAGDTYKFYVTSPEKNIKVYIMYTISDYLAP